MAGELSKLDDGEYAAMAHEASQSIFRPIIEEIQKIPFFVPAIAHPERTSREDIPEEAMPHPCQYSV